MKNEQTQTNYRDRLTLRDMVECGSIEESVAETLSHAVQERGTIVVCGKTGSGETTLLNALVYEIPHEHRVVTVEDPTVLQFPEHLDVLNIVEALGADRCRFIGRGGIVRDAVRMRPDRIVVGECREGDAYEMLDGAFGGRALLTTLCADSAAHAVERLTAMIRSEKEGDDPEAVRGAEVIVGHVVDLVVHVGRSSSGEIFVTELNGLSVGFTGCSCRCVLTKLYSRVSSKEPGEWVAVPDWLYGLKLKKFVEEVYQGAFGGDVLMDNTVEPVKKTQDPQ